MKKCIVYALVFMVTFGCFACESDDEKDSSLLTKAKKIYENITISYNAQVDMTEWTYNDKTNPDDEYTKIILYSKEFEGENSKVTVSGYATEDKSKHRVTVGFNNYQSDTYGKIAGSIDEEYVYDSEQSKYSRKMTTTEGTTGYYTFPNESRTYTVLLSMEIVGYTNNGEVSEKGTITVNGTEFDIVTDILGQEATEVTQLEALSLYSKAMGAFNTMFSQAKPTSSTLQTRKKLLGGEVRLNENYNTSDSIYSSDNLSVTGGFTDEYNYDFTMTVTNFDAGGNGICNGTIHAVATRDSGSNILTSTQDSEYSLTIEGDTYDLALNLKYTMNTDTEVTTYELVKLTVDGTEFNLGNLLQEN